MDQMRIASEIDKNRVVRKRRIHFGFFAAFLNFNFNVILVKALIVTLLFIPSLSFAVEDTPTIKRLLKNSIDMLVKQKPHAAKILLNQVLLLSPGHAEAYFRIGQAYMQQRKAIEAVEHIEKSVLLDPSNVIYGMYLAKIYDKQGDLVKAQIEYQRLIDADLKSDRVAEIEKLFSLITGRILAQKNEMNAALLVFNGLLLDYPDDHQVLFNISNAYMALNRYEEAEAVYRKLFELNSDNATVNFSLAKIYSTTNRPLLAMQHLKNIIDLGQNDERYKLATIEYNIISGREFLKVNNWNAALAAYKIAVELDPMRTEAFFNISMAHLQLRSTKLAERGFLNVLRINPAHYVARLNLAQMYYNLEKIEESKEQLRYIIEHDESGDFSNQAKIRLNVIHTLLADEALESGNIEKSLLEYSKALDFFSANVKASFNRGMIYIQKENFSAAQLEFESVIRHEPENMQARINLANIYERLNNYAQAAEQYEIVQEAGKETPEGVYAAARWRNAKARGLWGNGQLDESEALFEEIVVDEPGNFEAHTYLGIIQSSKGDLEAAASSYQNVLDLKPANYPVKILLGRVYEQLGFDSLAANEYRSIIFAGGGVVQIPEAEFRLDEVEARLSGFSNTLNYQYSYDSNLNLNDDDPLAEVKSDLALSFNYGVKTTDRLSFRFSWRPTYSTYLISQTDYLRSDIQSNVSYGTPDDKWSATVSSQNLSSLVNDQALSEIANLNFTRSKKMFLSPFFQLAKEEAEKNRIATSGVIGLSLRRVISFSEIPVRSMAGSLTLSLFQNLKSGIGTNLSYSLSVQRSLKEVVNIDDANIRVVADPLTGLEDQIADKVTTYDSNDYEFNSHTVAISFRKVLAPGVVGVFALNTALTAYINPDSGALASEGKRTNRINFTVGSGFNISYFFFKDLRVFFATNYQQNFSNLPVGLSSGLRGEDAVAIFQSTSLGSYSRYSLELGFTMNF